MSYESEGQTVRRDRSRQWNPFCYRGRIDNPEHVFGRDAELHDALRIAGHGGNVVISGPPRIGKSSLLSLVYHTLRLRVMAQDQPASRPVVGFIDVDTFPDEKALLRSLAGFYGKRFESPAELARFVETQTGETDVYLCMDEYHLN